MRDLSFWEVSISKVLPNFAKILAKRTVSISKARGRAVAGIKSDRDKNLN